MQWEDSQEQSETVPQPVSTTDGEPPRALRSAKRAKTAGKAREREDEQQEPAAEAQGVSGVETAEERRARKGKAPVRPDPRSSKGSVKTPGRGPVWESVQPAERLVTDDESSNTDDSGSEVSGLSLASWRRLRRLRHVFHRNSSKNWIALSKAPADRRPDAKCSQTRFSVHHAATYRWSARVIRMASKEEVEQEALLRVRHQRRPQRLRQGRNAVSCKAFRNRSWTIMSTMISSWSTLMANRCSMTRTTP